MQSIRVSLIHQTTCLFFLLFSFFSYFSFVCFFLKFFQWFAWFIQVILKRVPTILQFTQYKTTTMHTFVIFISMLHAISRDVISSGIWCMLSHPTFTINMKYKLLQFHKQLKRKNNLNKWKKKQNHQMHHWKYASQFHF